MYLQYWCHLHKYHKRLHLYYPGDIVYNRYVNTGDIDLEDSQSYFSKFSKRVQGLSLSTNFKNEDSEFTTFAAGALVRGQFSTSQFVGQEGNQGPYKLKGPNNELYVLVVSGSETVYVNGIPFDKANFRKKIKGIPLVKHTEKQTNVKHRPANLFSFDAENELERLEQSAWIFKM